MLHHGAGLRRVSKNEQLVQDLWQDYRQADLSPADRAMLDYSVKLGRTPEAVTREDVESLRSHGFTDTDILDVVQVVSYFAYVNRMALGLGVELEDYWGEEDLAAVGAPAAKLG